MLKRTTRVPRAGRRLLVRLLPALLLAGFVPAALPVPAAAGGSPISIAASPSNDVAFGSAATVTATTTFDIGPTPLWSQIYDLNTGARIAICGSGTTCSITIDPTSGPTFGRYVAWLGAATSTPPSPTASMESAELDVSWNAIDVHLTGAGTVLSPTQFAIDLTATTPIDVGPTPYYTEIFDLNTGARIAVCGSGTSCARRVIISPTANFKYQAFVANLTSQVPASFQGASQYLTSLGKG